MDLDLYEPLEGPDPIRLVFIEPGAFDDPIGCLLVHATIKFELPYLALSYVWGDPTSKVPIRLNEQEFLVTKNLDMAIRRVRQEEKLSLYWIDAICINQADVEERNQQVKMMREIYSSACQVVIYVGEAGEGAEEGINLMRLLDVIADDINPDPSQPYEVTEGGIHESALPQPDSPEWDHFQDFFRRPWFTRVWVLQEVAVATEDPIVVCGEHQLFWSMIGKVAQFYHQSGLVWSRPIKDRSYHAMVMSWCRDPANKYSIVNLLTMTGKFQATDPRDRLFALYGLAQEVENPAAKEGFQIDYAKPTSEIYRSFTFNYLKLYGAPDILIALDISQENTVEDLPSWVPDWGASLNEAHRPHPFMIDGTLESYYASAGFNAVLISLATEQDVLRIGISVHDEIAWVSDAFEDEDFDILAAFRRPGLLMRIWNEVHSRLSSSLDLESITEAFWRTLIANVDKGRRAVDDSFYMHFLSYWRQTRIVDRDAEEYITTHPTRPAYDDYESRKKIKKEFDDGRCQSEEWYAALQRAIDKSFFDNGVVCTNPTQSKDSDCKHCKVRNDPGMILNQRMLPVEGKDPALEFEDTDPFLKDYFHRLENDISEPMPAVYGDTNEFVRAFVTCCSHRRFFITKKGLLGVGPRATRVGDNAAVVAGGSMPFVIRRTNLIVLREGALTFDFEDPSLYRHYFIGPAYVHHLMNGEGVPQVEPGNFEWKMIDFV